MSAVPLPLSALLLRADVWRGDALGSAEQAGVASGFASLDALLPGGGWPRGALTELLLPRAGLGGGLGELALLRPALKALDADAGWVLLVSPPWRPLAPAWQGFGPGLSRLLVVEAARDDAAWACEQLLASGSVAALLAWLPDSDAKALRRLQLAMAGQQTLAFVFRPDQVVGSASPAPLRISLEADEAGLKLHIVKRRGPPLAAPLTLQVERPVSWARLAARQVLASRQPAVVTRGGAPEGRVVNAADAARA